MAYEAEIQRIKDGDGRVRDFPYPIERDHEMARALLDAGKRLAS